MESIDLTGNKSKKLELKNDIASAFDKRSKEAEKTHQRRYNIVPIRFVEADVSDIIDSVEQLLYGSKDIDITEKLAGQHLMVNINRNFATVNTKDQILRNEEPRNAAYSRWGAELTRGIITYLKHHKLPEQKWGFEIINPRTNHDYINYNNDNIIFVEYTGNLSVDVANKLRKYIKCKLLTKNDIKIRINKNPDFLKIQNVWESKLKPRFHAMQKGRRNNKLIYQTKCILSVLLEKCIVSAIDNTSPIEGVVIGTKTPIKLQTNTFLDVQRVQMPVYSIFKIPKTEIEPVMDNPNLSFNEIKEKFDVKLDPIYAKNVEYSLYVTIKHYLQKNSGLEGIDNNKYNIWLTPKESKEMLNKLDRDNVKQIYLELYNIAKSRKS